MGKFTFSCITASVITMAALAIATGSQAQTPAPAACGTEVYSAADQKYVGVPCPAATQNAAGTNTPCGPEVYSAADQRYVGVPCTAPAPKVEAGKTAAACGTEVYSVADQKYVGVPCPH